MLVDDDIVGDMKAQPGAYTLRLGGIESVEDVRLDIRRNTRPAIDDFYYHVTALCIGAYSYFALPFHGVGGVIENVGPHLVQLAGECLDAWQVGRIFPL